MNDATAGIGLRCPKCRGLAALVVTPTQAFCGDDDCDVLMWNPQLPDGGMDQASTVQLERDFLGRFRVGD